MKGNGKKELYLVFRFKLLLNNKKIKINNIINNNSHLKIKREIKINSIRKCLVKKRNNKIN